MREQVTNAAELNYYCGRCGRLTKEQTKQEEVDETCITSCLSCGDEVAGPLASGHYTPGPWAVNPDGETVVAGHDLVDTAIANTTGKSIDAAFFGQTYEEQQANVRLIASAPEMYEALKLMQKSLNGSPFDTMGMLRAHRAVDAAIAKAEGTDTNAT